MFLNSFLRLTVVASVVYCCVFDQPLYLCIPLVTLAIFLIRGVVSADGDAERIDDLADQSYFLAFSGTMSALLGMLGRFYLLGEGADDLRPAELMGAIALVATLFGILSMTTLKDYAQKLADGGSPPKVSTGSDAALGSSESIRPAESAIAAYEDLAEINRKVAELVDQTAEHLAKLAVAADSLGSALLRAQEFADSLEPAIRRAHKFSEEFISDVEQMNSVIDEFERLQERVLDVEVPA